MSDLTYILRMPPSTWTPDPFPGSAEALAVGCRCPAEQEGRPEQLEIHTECPVHQIEHVPH